MFAITGTRVWVLVVPFAPVGIGIGADETAEHSAVAALAPAHLRGSAFGLLAAVQSLDNFAASAIAGLLWTLITPVVAFAYLTAWMIVAVLALIFAARSRAATS